MRTPLWVLKLAGMRGKVLKLPDGSFTRILYTTPEGETYVTNAASTRYATRRTRQSHSITLEQKDGWASEVFRARFRDNTDHGITRMLAKRFGVTSDGLDVALASVVEIALAIRDGDRGRLRRDVRSSDEGLFRLTVVPKGDSWLDVRLTSRVDSERIDLSVHIDPSSHVKIQHVQWSDSGLWFPGHYGELSGHLGRLAVTGIYEARGSLGPVIGLADGFPSSLRELRSALPALLGAVAEGLPPDAVLGLETGAQVWYSLRSEEEVVVTMRRGGFRFEVVVGVPRADVSRAIKVLDEDLPRDPQAIDWKALEAAARRDGDGSPTWRGRWTRTSAA